MRAAVVRKFGPPEVLEVQEWPDPVLARGQVVLEVAAADVLFLETMIRRGDAPEGMAPQLPYVPGSGVAGRVVAVGSGVEASWIGRTAVAHTGREGGYADRALVDIDSLSAVPDGLGLTDAAALLHDAPTALTLFDLTGAASAGSVLVLGASGGLGLMLVQLARTSGVRVLAVARDEAKLERIRAMAPDGSVIDSEQPDWIEQAREALGDTGADVVFDNVGGTLGEAVFQLTANGGHYSAHGTPSGQFAAIDPEQAARRSVTLTGIGTVQLDKPALKLATERALASARVRRGRLRSRTAGPALLWGCPRRRLRRGRPWSPERGDRRPRAVLA
jgi:NADPH:quinone reductase